MHCVKIKKCRKISHNVIVIDSLFSLTLRAISYKICICEIDLSRLMICTFQRAIRHVRYLSQKVSFYTINEIIVQIVQDFLKHS